MPHAVAAIGCAVIVAGAAVLINELVVQPHLEERRRRQREHDEEQEMLERAISVSLYEYDMQHQHASSTAVDRDGASGTLRHRRNGSQRSPNSYNRDPIVHSAQSTNVPYDLLYNDPFCLHVAGVRISNVDPAQTVQDMLAIIKRFGTVAKCECVRRDAQNADFEAIYESTVAANAAIMALDGADTGGRVVQAAIIPLPGQDEPIASFEEDDFPGFRPAATSQTSLGYTARSPTPARRSFSPVLSDKSEMSQRKTGASIVSGSAGQLLSGRESPYDSIDRFEDSQYSVIEPSRPASRASRSPLVESFHSVQASSSEDGPDPVLVDNPISSVEDAAPDRSPSPASSLSSGITIISRPDTPVYAEAGGRAGSDGGSASGWEDLGDESSDDEEGDLFSRPAGQAHL